MGLISQLSKQFLIAMPGLQDPNFSHTVTFLCEHNPQGAMGLLINRLTPMNLGDLAGQLGIDLDEPDTARIPIYRGGPVQPEQGFVLHTPQGEWDNTLELGSDLALTVSQDIIEAISHGLGPEKFIITLGYAGWGAGQLEEEIAANSWLNGPADNRVIFDVPQDERWSTAAALLGIELSLISHDVGHA